MRIIYFCYCDDEGLLHEYNLQQGIRVAKVGAREFAVASLNALSKTFFSYQNRENITISAIIGANGSGKTSFARLICKLAEEQSIHAVLVLEDEGSFCVVRNIPAEFIAQDKGAESIAEELNSVANTSSFNALRKGGWRFAYYSPNYSPQHEMRSIDRFFIDCSTSWLMKNPREQASPGIGSQSWYRFEKEESNRVWEFLFEDAKERRRREIYGEDVSVMPEIKLFKGVEVGIREERIKSFERRFEDNLKKLQEEHTPLAMMRKPPRATSRSSLDDYTDTPGGEFCKEVIAFIRRCYAVRTFFARFVYAYVLSYCEGNGFGIYKDPDEYAQQLLMLRDIIARDEPQLINQSLASLMGSSMAMSNETHDALSYIRDGFMALSDWKNTMSNEDIRIRFNIKKRNVFLDFVSGYAILRGQGDFLSFKESPKVSSGEWAMIAMLSRLHQVLKESTSDRFVLFLDEAETTMHPEWQRSLVKKLIQFIEAFFPSKRIHIIFASHSPILLSDIPSGNVVLLDKHKTLVRNTFACNIFDLYHIPFNLGHGAIGEFAADKLERVLTRIKTVRDSSKNDLKIRFNTAENEIVSLTGDMFLRDYFRHCSGR